MQHLFELDSFDAILRRMDGTRSTSLLHYEFAALHALRALRALQAKLESEYFR